MRRAGNLKGLDKTDENLVTIKRHCAESHNEGSVLGIGAEGVVYKRI